MSVGYGLYFFEVGCRDPVPVGRTHIAIVKSWCGASRLFLKSEMCGFQVLFQGVEWGPSGLGVWGLSEGRVEGKGRWRVRIAGFGVRVRSSGCWGRVQGSVVEKESEGEEQGKGEGEGEQEDEGEWERGR